MRCTVSISYIFSVCYCFNGHQITDDERKSLSVHCLLPFVSVCVCVLFYCKLVLLLSKPIYEQHNTAHSNKSTIENILASSFFSLSYAYVEMRRLLLVPKRRNSCRVSAGSNKISICRYSTEPKQSDSNFIRLLIHSHASACYTLKSAL